MLNPLTTPASQPIVRSEARSRRSARRLVTARYANMNDPPNTFRQTSIVQSPTGIRRVKYPALLHATAAPAIAATPSFSADRFTARRRCRAHPEESVLPEAGEPPWEAVS